MRSGQVSGRRRRVLGGGHRAALGAGSGIVLGEGKIRTNAHNQRVDKVMVAFADGCAADGTVAELTTHVTLGDADA